MNLRDKVFILSGVGPGMGRKLAVQAAREGAKVVLAARSADFLDKVAAEIEDIKGRHLAVPTDVTDAAQCQQLVAKTVQAFGRVDGLVNAAYLYDPPVPIEQLDVESWSAGFNVTLAGALRMTQAVVPHMKKQGGGSIVNIGSMVVRKPGGADGVIYVTAKGALAAATRQLAFELGPFNIRVNNVVNGWMWGSAVEAYFRMNAEKTGVSVQAQIDAVAAHTALRRIPTDEECAKSVLFFMSDYSCVVTGASLDVNGGEYMPQ